MTDETVDEFADGEWDLGDILTEQKQPTDTVDVYLNPAASYAKAQLVKAHGNASGDDVAKIDAQIDEVDALLEASHYVVHLRAVPSRMREDITSKALAKYPYKLNLLGQDDPANSRERLAYENDLIWLAQITDVVNPRGQHRANWTFEQMQEFVKALPTKAQNKIDSAIKELTTQAEEYSVRSQSVDF
jgi:hypothetical protein